MKQRKQKVGAALVQSAQQPTLVAGARFYYTGDMANQSGSGVIESVTPGQWGTQVVCRFDDPMRAPFNVTPASFGAHAGCRFRLEDEYLQERAAQVATFTKEPVEVVLAKLREAAARDAERDRANTEAPAEYDPPSNCD